MSIPPRVPWLIWRVVLKQFASLQEIETHYSLADVLIANQLIDCQEEADRLAQKKVATS